MISELVKNNVEDFNYYIPLIGKSFELTISSGGNEFIATVYNIEKEGSRLVFMTNLIYARSKNYAAREIRFLLREDGKLNLGELVSDYVCSVEDIWTLIGNHNLNTKTEEVVIEF